MKRARILWVRSLLEPLAALLVLLMCGIALVALGWVIVGDEEAPQRLQGVEVANLPRRVMLEPEPPIDTGGAYVSARRCKRIGQEVELEIETGGMPSPEGPEVIVGLALDGRTQGRILGFFLAPVRTMPERFVLSSEDLAPSDRRVYQGMVTHEGALEAEQCTVVIIGSLDGQVAFREPASSVPVR